VGADGRKAKLMKSYFWKHQPDVNHFDQEAGVIAQNSYNQGLIAGFMQGRELSANQNKLFWKDIGNRAGDQSHLGEMSDWSEREWIDWYIIAAATFRRYHLQ